MRDDTVVPVLHVLPAATTVGGGPRHLLAIVGGLDRARFDVTVACSRNGPLAASLEALGARVADVDLMATRLNLAAFACLVRTMRRVRPKVVHLHGTRAAFWGGLAAVVARVPGRIYENLDIAFVESRSSRAQRFYRWVDWVNCRVSNAFVIGNGIELQRFYDHRLVKPDRVSVVHYGIDVDAIDAARSGTSREAKRRDLGIPDARHVVVGMVATLDEKKGPEYFIRAAALVHRDFPDVHFVLAGNGPLLSRLQALRSELALDEHLTLAGTRNDWPSLVEAFDICALSSLWEGLPLFLLESMAAGKPVVSTNVGGIAEAVIDGETGYLVPPRDSAALASAIAPLVADEGLRAAVGSRARQLVAAQFRPAAAIACYERLYMELAG